MNSNYKKGFTLIELLVVVAIIGLLSSIISVAVNSSRTKARDARRVSDMKQIQSGLNLYFNTGSGYPEKTVYDAAAAAGTNVACSGTPTLTPPKDPGIYTYTYTATGSSSTGCGGTVYAGYTVQFYIEGQGQYYIMNDNGKVTTTGGTAVTLDSLL